MKIERIPLSDVEVRATHRRVDVEVVKQLAGSMHRMGLLQPITVCRDRANSSVLISGRHRLEAAKDLGWDEIGAIVTTDDEVQCRMMEISENLHRSELSELERSEQIAEWVKLTAVIDKPGQIAQVSGGGGRGNVGGQSKAARDLGLERTEVRRAIQISGITPEAKKAAAQAGLSNKKGKLLEIAREEDDRQLSKVREFAAVSDQRRGIKPGNEGLREFDSYICEIRRKISKFSPNHYQATSVPEDDLLRIGKFLIAVAELKQSAAGKPGSTNTLRGNDLEAGSTVDERTKNYPEHDALRGATAAVS